MKKKMNKLVALGLCLTMVLSSVGCSSKADNSKANKDSANSESASGSETKEQTVSSDKKVKVGFIFVGSKSDYGYNQAAYEGSVAVEEYFGDKVEVIRSENIPETAEASRVLEQMIQQGAEVLFPTSYGHLEPAMEVAAEYPDKVFYHQGGLQTSENLGTYFGTVWESFYLSGIAAGSCTKTNKLGFVASFPIPQVLDNINAFQLGAQSVNPEVTTTVIFTGDWSDPALQTSAANTLIDGGIDVISQHQDSTKTIVEICENAGIYTTGNHVDASELASNAWLTGAVWNWGPLFIDMTQTALDEKFDGSIYDGKYRGGLKEGVIDIAPFGKSVPEDVQALILETKEKMISGEIYAFEGEIRKQDGSILVKEGERLTLDEVESMDYFVEGVIGSIK
ncbi:BMP family ABC transporter substrate-binding protein [Anaerosporobacter sp.]|uniref:BMP family ABC transporter substrate-binding protein n=1 Tax=Anaerosporobacter sp. TaxID=1872529 RepID=UPI00286F7071|nr:BMP family ABC transporter substrate-binding protein [Anaerosporobacter sp.]